MSWLYKQCFFFASFNIFRASQVALVVKNPPANAGNLRDAGSIPGLGRSPGGGHGNLLQYSCLEKPMDRGAWQAPVHGVTKSWTQLLKYLLRSCMYLFPWYWLLKGFYIFLLWVKDISIVFYCSLTPKKPQKKFLCMSYASMSCFFLWHLASNRNAECLAIYTPIFH